MLSANEGDARDWPGISSNGEETRRARAAADLTLFPDAADNARLGRLNVTPFAPATSRDGKLTSLYSLGSRSFSIRTEDGRLVLIDPSPEGLKEVTETRLFDESKNWNPPALVDGRLYARNHREMACFDLRADPE